MKLNIEESLPKKFVRIGTEIYIGSNHRSILENIGWASDGQEIKTRLKSVPQGEIDMGLIMRRPDDVVLGKNSDTFSYPPEEILKEIRIKTLEILNEIYNEDKFIDEKYGKTISCTRNIGRRE